MDKQYLYRAHGLDMDGNFITVYVAAGTLSEAMSKAESYFRNYKGTLQGIGTETDDTTFFVA